MTYGSNESLYYPDEELDLNLRTGTPLQKSFEKVDVLYAAPNNTLVELVYTTHMPEEKGTLLLSLPRSQMPVLSKVAHRCELDRVQF